MRIFLSVLIIVIAVLIAVRFVILYMNVSGNSKHEGAMHLVGIAASVLIGGFALWFLLSGKEFEDVLIIMEAVAFFVLAAIFYLKALMLILAIVILFLAPFFLVPYGIKKKKKAPIIVSSAVWGPVYLFLLIVFTIYPREYPYVDLWVYGKTAAQIEEKYGEPVYYENDTLYYRCNWWSNNGYNYYCVELNEEGEARKIYQDFYDKTWAIGKTFDEVEEKFGKGSYWPHEYYYIYDYKLSYEDGVVIDFDTGEFP